MFDVGSSSITYQGNTPVNDAIAKTSDKRIEFPLRNNGVTIVARKLQRVGHEFQIEDFQIVNGCQTSHVIVLNRGPENDATLLPVKIIATEDEEVTRQVIIASNHRIKLIKKVSGHSIQYTSKSRFFSSQSLESSGYFTRDDRGSSTLSGVSACETD